MHGVRI